MREINIYLFCNDKNYYDLRLRAARAAAPNAKGKITKNKGAARKNGITICCFVMQIFMRY